MSRSSSSDSSTAVSSSSSSSLCVPIINLTEPTPLKKSTCQSYRLLYSGSLVLSDTKTEVSLEGICFVAHLPLSSPPTSFLSSPLPLALESMHGRPSLRIMGLMDLDESRLEMDGVDVRLYWHPLLAHHAQEFFLSVVWKLGGWDEDGRSKKCVKIVLGDEDNDDGGNEIIVYGQSACVPVPDPNEAPTPTTVHFIATRLLPPKPPQLHPRHPIKRLPRPDDPLPRRPLFASSACGSPGRKGLKRLASSSAQDRLRKKGKIVLDHPKDPINRTKSASALLFNNPSGRPNQFHASLSLAALGTKSQMGGPGGGMKRARSRTYSISSAGGVSDVEDGVFKVPSVSTTTAKRKTDPVVVPVPVEGFGALKTNEPELTELEKSNKNTIKKLCVSCLATRGVSKDHPEFKELYNWVSRGVQFALRKTLNVQKLERECVKALLLKHIDMYADEPPFADASALGT